jgi:hypothetical protein
MERWRRRRETPERGAGAVGLRWEAGRVPWRRPRRHEELPEPEQATPADGAEREGVELRLTVSPEAARRLEAGVPCREIRIEHLGDNRIALLLWASDREQWVRQVVARAAQAPWN